MSAPPTAINTAALYFTGRLTRALEAVLDTRLTLVEAPMGYGKTVAVREYLRARAVRAVWTSVLSTGEDAFWRDFCRSIAGAFPDAADTVESLSRLGYPRDAVLADAARELLLQLDFSPGTVLVLDDVHLLPDSGSGPGPGRDGGMAGLCDMLARQGVDNLRLVLISRDIWTGGRGGRGMAALKGMLAVIDRDSFALNAEEIREYYTLCGLPVTLKEAAALRRITGGWISALYLYLLRYSKDSERARSGSSQLAGSPKLPGSIGELLDEGIFSLLPQASKDLLLVLSPLERFTAEQAAFLSDGADVSAALLDLRRKNSFIAYDEERETYALHSLFRQYLRERFENLPKDRRNAAHCRMADWFTLQKDASSAIEACCAAGEYERALRILESDMSRNMVTERSRFFVEMFKACPEEVLERHMGAAFKYAIAAFAAGDRQSFGAQLARIGRQCAARATEKGEDDPEVRAWRGELEFLLSLAAYNDIRAMSARHRQANALLQRPTRLFGPESPWTLGCPSVLFMFHRTPGRLDEELADMDECLPHYYTLAAMHGAGGEHQMRAEALYNRGDFTNAAVFCHKAEAMARANGQLSVVLCSMFLRLRLALIDGRREEAERLLTEMRGLIREKRDYFLLHTVDLCEGWLRAFTGEPDRFPDWLRFDPGGESKLYTFAGGYYYVAHGSALLLAGEYATVSGLFGWLLQSGAFANHLLFAVYAHIYMATANAALGLKKEADAPLRAALDLALPDKLYLPFAEHHGLPDDLLERACRERPAALKAIRSLAEKMKAGKKAALRGGPHIETPPFGLSRREYETASLMAEGLSNREIAEALFVGVNTVKTHLKAAYRKTGAASRSALKKMLRQA